VALRSCQISFRWLVLISVLLIPAVELGAQNVTFSAYDLPSPTGQEAHPTGITTGPDGALWVTAAGQVYRISAAGEITRYPLPEPDKRAAWKITAGPDGALWFTTTNAEIGRMATDGSVEIYPLAIFNPPPFFVDGITAGPDGALWFAEESPNKIGRITTDGKVSEFVVPTPNSQPTAITAGPDGALWFTEANANKIGRITTTGVITAEYLIATSKDADIRAITTGPDGALWFAETLGNKIGRITTAGVITEYVIPTPGAESWGIAKGPDGALWFTEFRNRIGRITTTGQISEFVLPSTDSTPIDIVAGPDGALWFTDQDGAGTACGSAVRTHKVGRAMPDTFSGSTAHLVSGGGWKTTFTITNGGGATAGVEIKFFGDNGDPLVLPISSPLQPGATTNTSTISLPLPAHFTVVLETEAGPGETPRQGWAQVIAGKTVSSFAVFRLNADAGPQEAVVPLETRDGSYILAFDNHDFVTGVAVANPSPLPASILVSLWDEAGALLGTDTIALPPHGHKAFTLTDSSQFATIAPLAAGRRGAIAFDRPLSGQISVLGLRFTPTGAFTSIPVAAK
jgi:virginiamycin B lyase